MASTTYFIWLEKNMDQEVAILVNIMIKRYGFDALISGFCDGINIVENDDFYECAIRLTESEKQRNKIMQCKEQFENIDATIIMPQKINKKVYILLKKDLSLESSIRKTIHEFIHLFHRCMITEKMKLVDLYEIEENRDYKLFYYLDEFLTKKKEIFIYYDLLHKNQKIVENEVYISTMAEKFKFARKSMDIVSFMRDELFAIAETMAYSSIFPSMFPEYFVENHASMSNMGEIIEFCSKFDSIDVFINNRSELKMMIHLLEKNFGDSYQ